MKSFRGPLVIGIEDIPKALNSGLWALSRIVSVRCGMWGVISMQITPAGERRGDLCLSIWLLQEVQASKVCHIHIMSTKHMVVRGSLGNKFDVNVCDRSSAASVSCRILNFLRQFYRSDCAFGTLSRCNFLPWTSSHYLVWLGSKVTGSNLFPSLVLTEKWRMITSFVSSLAFTH